MREAAKFIECARHRDCFREAGHAGDCERSDGMNLAPFVRAAERAPVRCRKGHTIHVKGCRDCGYLRWSRVR